MIRRTCLFPLWALASLHCDGASPVVTPTDASVTADVVVPGDVVTTDRVGDTPAVDAPPTMCLEAQGSGTAATNVLVDGSDRATVTVVDPSQCLRTYRLTTTAALRDAMPENPRTVVERAGWPTLRTRNDLFDSLYAMAIDEARQNSVGGIRDGGFNNGQEIPCPAEGCFQTGRLWTYVWTRDTSFSVDLGLGALDPLRARNSLAFKLSDRRTGGDVQVVQDTGTGGSYPVSSDRVVWALGATTLLRYLDGEAGDAFRQQALGALRNTVEHDRRVVYDESLGLYRGEHSFLDWREQSYPAWTAADNAHIAMSCSLSTNVLHYIALDAVSNLARDGGDMSSAQRYRQWADALRTAIRERFWLADAQQFSAFTTTGLDPSPVHRYDLLGSALAVLSGVADDAQARTVVSRYPHAGKGLAVLWPQQQFTAIYHNRASWPFVTAYWLRAARRARNDASVNWNVDAMIRAAAVNLSNMENFEFLSGRSRVDDGMYSGPVVNSQRQLWSVAGYLSMVHDTLFGIEVTDAGVRVRPYVTRQMRNTLFANADTLVLNDWRYRGHRLNVVVRLPPRGEDRAGAYAVGAARLDGVAVTDTLTTATLPVQGTLEVTLVDTPEAAATIATAGDVGDYRNVFGPRTPTVTEVAATGDGARLQVRFDLAGESTMNVRAVIFRDGRAVATLEPGDAGPWVDPDSADHATTTHCYTVETRYLNGNASQHAAPVCDWGRDGQRVQTIPAAMMQAVGGTLSDNHGRTHYENWGDPGNTLTAPMVRAERAGTYLVQVIAGNGSGPFNTGITCAVKRVTVEDLAGDAVVGTGILAMPQTQDWDTWRDSTLVRVRLEAGHAYRVRIHDDATAVNMSAFRHFAQYTGGTGGASGAFDRVNIAALKVLYLGP